MHGTYRFGISHLLTDINIHSDTQAEPRKLSSLTLYIDLWQEGKPAPGQNPPVISPPVVISRRTRVRAEIRTQSPVLSNTRLAKMVPLSHLRRLKALVVHCAYDFRSRTLIVDLTGVSIVRFCRTSEAMLDSAGNVAKI
jgi:hypothetical protein